MDITTKALDDDERTAILDELTDDGDTCEIERNGVTYTYRLRIEHDQDCRINDYECYGKTSTYSYDWRDGRVARPEGFTGAACKIEIDRSSWIWWEPCEDLRSKRAWVKAGGDPDAYDEAYKFHKRQATQLLQDGFYVVSVELFGPATDTIGASHVVEIGVELVGGVDSVKPEYLRDLLADLLAGFPDLPA